MRLCPDKEEKMTDIVTVNKWDCPAKEEKMTDIGTVNEQDEILSWYKGEKMTNIIGVNE